MKFKTPLDEHTSVHDDPEVMQAHAAFTAAREQYEPIAARVRELDRLCAPDTEHPDRLAQVRAQAALPAARLELWEREAALEQARMAHLQAVAAATRVLEEARREPRKQMIRQLLDVLHDAQKIANDIQAFDDQTMALGGKPPLAPIGELLSGPYQQSFVQASEWVLRREGWL